MKRQSGLTIAGFVILLITFIVQMLVVIGGSAIAYSQTWGASFGGYFQMIGLFYKSGGFVSVLATLTLFAPLLWAIAFASEGRGRFVGRIICGVFLALLSASVYIKLASWMESSLSSIGYVYGTAATILRVVLYGAISVTVLMLVSIFFSVRVTGIISAVGVGVFIGVLFYVLFQILSTSSMLSSAILQEVGDYSDVGQFIRGGSFSAVMVLMGAHCFLILLGKFFCCLGAGRKY